ncbi:MAG: hypothetical protein DLM60_17245 [Pseudonocardiales bacterium]|nr:MAG: hypothetical protein DLM60_17245 [Pseudonocardiales bacterium]
MTDRLRTNLAEVLRDVETESARLKEPTVTTEDSAREQLVAAVDSFRDRAADRVARAAVEIQRAEPSRTDHLARAAEGFRARAAEKLAQVMPERVAEQQAISAAYAEAEIKRRIEQARRQAMRPSGP